jgi:hypothetical protein
MRVLVEGAERHAGFDAFEPDLAGAGIASACSGQVPSALRRDSSAPISVERTSTISRTDGTVE